MTQKKIMYLWKALPLKCSGLPDWPLPFSPLGKRLVHSKNVGRVCQHTSAQGPEVFSSPWDNVGKKLQIIKIR